MHHAGRPARAEAQAGAAGQSAAPPAGPTTVWPTYGGNLASQRYSPADEITADNFNRLRIAWRLKTDALGPRPDTLYSATPLYVNGVLYTTAGQRRAAIALDPASGEMLWMLENRDIQPHAVVLYLGNFAIVASNGVPLYWPDYPADCPLGRLGWPPSSVR